MLTGFRRIALAIALLRVVPVAAQMQIGDLHMGLGGNINAGYSADYSNPGSSDHGLGLGGDGFLNGYYYNPNFVSFNAQPYYDRSQSNSTSSSISDSSGYTGNVSLFSGTHFPGSANFNQTWNSTGLFGIPNTVGLTTTNNGHGFGVGWAALMPNLPSLSLSYSRGYGTSSVIGSDAQTDTTTRNFTVRSGYRLAGFTLGGGYSHLDTDSNSFGLLDTGAQLTSNVSDTYSFNLAHSLPLHGGFGVQFGRTDYTSSYTGGSSNGTTDNVSANLGLQIWRLPISATVNYTDNLYGSLQQQFLTNGGTLLIPNISPESHQLLVNVSTSYRVMAHVFLTGFVSRQEESIAGQSYGYTQFGGNANFNFGKRLKGLSVSIGMNDSVNQEGNQGAGLLANVNYTRSFGKWELGSSFSYDQNVQTYLATYTMSTMNYNAQIRRRLFKGLTWNVGGGGGRSGFEQQSGNGSSSESVSTSLSWHRFTVAGNYSISSGTSVLTPTGLVVTPLPRPSFRILLLSLMARATVSPWAPLQCGICQSVRRSTGRSATRRAKAYSPTMRVS